MKSSEESKGGESKEYTHERPGYVISVDVDPPQTTKADKGSGDGASKVKGSRKSRWLKKASNPMGLYTLALVVVAFGQWTVTYWQLKEMQSDSLQTDKLIKQTRNLALAAKAQAEAAKVQADAAVISANAAKVAANAAKDANRIYLESQRETLTQARDAMEASAMQSVASMEASVRNSRVDQRAWVGIKGINLDIQRDKNTPVEITFVNSGKTPARDVRFVLLLETLPKGQEPQFNYTEAMAENRGVLFPNAEMQGAEPILFSNQEIDEIKIGSSVFFISGTAWYRDIFDVEHKTLFCAVINSKNSSLEFCRTHNEAD